MRTRSSAIATSACGSALLCRCFCPPFGSAPVNASSAGLPSLLARRDGRLHSRRDAPPRTLSSLALRIPDRPQRPQDVAASDLVDAHVPKQGIRVVAKRCLPLRSRLRVAPGRAVDVDHLRGRLSERGRVRLGRRLTGLRRRMDRCRVLPGLRQPAVLERLLVCLRERRVGEVPRPRSRRRPQTVPHQIQCLLPDARPRRISPCSSKWPPVHRGGSGYPSRSRRRRHGARRCSSSAPWQRGRGRGPGIRLRVVWTLR